MSMSVGHLLDYPLKYEGSTTDGAISDQVGMGCIRKVAEKARGRKPESRVLPWSLLQFLPPGSSSEFLPWLQSKMDCKLYDEINPFLPNLVLVLFGS